LSIFKVMSWLFGLNKGQPGDQIPPFPGPPDSGGNGDDKPGDRQGQKIIGDGYRFDSAALERAAKAAKELEKSRMAI
jgi:ATPase family AAA domain-containing protein 3A/B